MQSFTYAALGDSTGVGIGADDGRGYPSRALALLQHHIPSARLVNLSVSGATSSTVLDRQVDRALVTRPDLVTLFVGGNDLWRATDPARFRKNMDTITARLATLGAPVILGNLPNMSHAPAAAYAESFLGLSRATIEARVLSYNASIASAAAKHGFEVVDLFTVGVADNPHYFCADGFHPSSEGYAVWTDLLWPHIERVVEAAA